MLAVVVVLFVAVGLSDGVILNECEVKQQIQSNLALPSNIPNLLAKIVCHIKLTSNFSTSAVRTMNVTEFVEPPEGAELPEKNRRKVRAVKKPKGKKTHPSKGVSHSTTESAEETHEVWTLYGLFQLSDHVACNSTQSTVPTLNLCKLTCDKLIDDNLTDDLACVKVLMAKFNANEIDELLEMVELLEQKECINAKNSQYFANCPV